jgi:transposase
MLKDQTADREWEDGVANHLTIAPGPYFIVRSGTMEEGKRRFVGIDVGKREYTMAIIGKNGKMSIHQGKTSTGGRQALYRLLEKTDKIALEAGNLAFIIAREIQERVGSEVRVLNAAKLPFIWDAPTKTDKEDAMKLAHLVEERRDEKLPIVPLPSEEEMGRRKVLASYRREQQNRTRMLNTLHAMFVHQGYTTVVRKDLVNAERRQQTIKVLQGQEREDAEYILKHLELYEQRIAELNKKIQEEANSDENMKVLQSICGVGPVVAYAFVAHVGNGSRFSKGGQVSNFMGFVPRLDFSGSIRRYGHITKQGNGYLRSLLVQAAYSAVRSKSGGALKERYKYLTMVKGTSKKKTIVSIARRLGEIMYAVLRNKTEYEPRPWSGPQNKTAIFAEKAMSA